MAKHEITIECNLNVSEATAKACLQMIELFLNSNSMFKIQQTIEEDGWISLTFEKRLPTEREEFLKWEANILNNIKSGKGLPPLKRTKDNE